MQVKSSVKRASNLGDQTRTSKYLTKFFYLYIFNVWLWLTWLLNRVEIDIPARTQD